MQGELYCISALLDMVILAAFAVVRRAQLSALHDSVKRPATLNEELSFSCNLSPEQEKLSTKKLLVLFPDFEPLQTYDAALKRSFDQFGKVPLFGIPVIIGIFALFKYLQANG